MFLLAGGTKLTQPKARPTASGPKWIEDFGAGKVKLIGAAEVPAAVVVWGRFGPYAFGA